MDVGCSLTWSLKHHPQALKRCANMSPFVEAMEKVTSRIQFIPPSPFATMTITTCMRGDAEFQDQPQRFAKWPASWNIGCDVSQKAPFAQWF